MAYIAAITADGGIPLTIRKTAGLPKVSLRGRGPCLVQCYVGKKKRGPDLFVSNAVLLLLHPLRVGDPELWECGGADAQPPVFQSCAVRATCMAWLSCSSHALLSL